MRDNVGYGEKSRIFFAAAICTESVRKQICQKKDFDFANPKKNTYLLSYNKVTVNSKQLAIQKLSILDFPF